MDYLVNLAFLRKQRILNTKDWKFQLGNPVKKIHGSSWRGKVVGFYSTEATEHGYAVESMFENGSVQIYPEAALKSMENAEAQIIGGTVIL